MKLFALFFLLVSSAFAIEDSPYYFHPMKWKPGLHLLAGGGLNAATYESGYQGNASGVGINGKTDIGYYFSDNFAVDFGSSVKFNRVEGNLIWDTLLNVGVRYRFEDSPWYSRVFIGRAPTVIYPKSVPEVYRATDPARIQYDGTVYGFSVGKMFVTKKGQVWFLEGSWTYQALEKATGIKNDGETPRTLFKDDANTRAVIYSIYATVGLLVF